MWERLRLRVLCRVARMLGFDLSDVTPEELRPPQTDARKIMDAKNGIKLGATK